MMERTKRYVKNIKQKFIADKLSKLNSYPTLMLKLTIALALFFIAAFMINASGITAEDGNLNISNNLVVNTNTLFVDASSNLIGIGITAPNAKLESLSATEQLRLSYNSSQYAQFTVDSGGRLQIKPSNALNDGNDVFQVMRGDGFAVLFGVRWNGVVYFSSGKLWDYVDSDTISVSPRTNSGSLVFNANSTERMRITPTGNVGIGTTSPTRKLHVIGNANVTGDLSYGTLTANSPHAFLNYEDRANDILKRTEICIVADDDVVVLQYLKNAGNGYEWAFEPNAEECLNKEIVTDIIIEYEDVFNEELNKTVQVEKSRTEIKKKVFQ